MTINPTNPPPVPDSERPGLSLAMELAQFVKEEIQKLDRSVQSQVQAALQANAATVKRMEQLEGSVRDLKSDLESRAAERVDKDFREAEARYILAREQKDRLSTQEKIEVHKLMEDHQTAARKARADYWRGFWDKITPNIATAMILAVLLPVWYLSCERWASRSPSWADKKSEPPAHKALAGGSRGITRTSRLPLSRCCIKQRTVSAEMVVGKTAIYSILNPGTLKFKC